MASAGNDDPLGAIDFCQKFERRFQGIERLASERGIKVAEAGLSVLDALWDEVKRQEQDE